MKRFLNNYSFCLKVHLRFLMPRLYSEYGTRMLVILEAPAVQASSEHLEARWPRAPSVSGAAKKLRGKLLGGRFVAAVNPAVLSSFSLR